MSDTYYPPQAPCFADLSGKTALVTGGGAGIGRAISLRLAAEGMTVVLCGRREDKLAETREAIAATGGTGIPVVSDLSQPQAAAELFDRIRQENLELDAMVHNAALVRGGSLADTDADYWRTMMATNADSAYFLAKECVAMMQPRGRGAMVFISTIGATRTHHKMIAYDTSKGAIEAFVRSLALELARTGIRVNAVAPGATLRKPPEPGTPIESIRQPYIPMGRYGSCEEIAAAVAFLSSAQASYITGQTLCVDGGATAQLSPPGVFI